MKACKELSRHQDLLQHALTVMHDDDNQSGGDNDLDDEQVTYIIVVMSSGIPLKY
jgi:hypothetical protein